MSDIEINERIEAIREVTREAIKSKETAIELLKEAGLYNEEIKTKSSDSPIESAKRFM